MRISDSIGNVVAFQLGHWLRLENGKSLSKKTRQVVTEHRQFKSTKVKPSTANILRLQTPRPRLSRIVPYLAE